MNRRNLLRALCLAPLAPVTAKLALLEGPAPTVLRSTANQGFSRATTFGTLSQDHMKVWSRDLFRETQKKSFSARELVEMGFIELVP